MAAFAALMAVPVAAGALDNTVVNDFWDTTAYVNASPVVAASQPADSVESFSTNERASDAIAVFCSQPAAATVLMLR